MSTLAKRYNTGKVEHRWWMCWVRALSGVARVGTMGATKYGAYNYLDGAPYSQSVESAMRHLLAWWNGEEEDPESGLNHLDHACWNIMRLADESRGPRAGELDDRPKEH